uniref:Hypotheticial protein n=1 Tax=Schistosoma japonicum TaxID=6182 RepID=C1L5M4_SCHJA|nr:hypotheticial protein [Schistosoma japonicum]CAX70002.1 hypotheticial protein [Schistosoma japonicum]CAX70004.1 hypotheticial protein [Schistosoma japonicum]CAX70005.1 hypotheticial protein [Schistosoma japonicum]
MIVTRRMFLCVVQMVAVLAIFSEYCSLGVNAWGAGDIDYSTFGRK